MTTQKEGVTAPATHPHAKKLFRTAFVALAVAVVLGGFVWYTNATSRISVDTAQIVAPAIALSAKGAGTLEELFVQPGDRVATNAVVARVGTELVKAKVDGEVLSVGDNVGALIAPGQPVVTMIDRDALRVIVRIKEDKGLERIHPGQFARFTVDAFPGRTYEGVVDEVAPTSRESGVVFSISDKRETKEFNVKIRFDATTYAELKNGMSSKVSIFTR